MADETVTDEMIEAACEALVFGHEGRWHDDTGVSGDHMRVAIEAALSAKPQDSDRVADLAGELERAQEREFGLNIQLGSCESLIGRLREALERAAKQFDEIADQLEQVSERKTLWDDGRKKHDYQMIGECKAAARALIATQEDKEDGRS